MTYDLANAVPKPSLELTISVFFQPGQCIRASRLASVALQIRILICRTHQFPRNAPALDWLRHIGVSHNQIAVSDYIFDKGLVALYIH